MRLRLCSSVGTSGVGLGKRRLSLDMRFGLEFVLFAWFGGRRIGIVSVGSRMRRR